jgi:predicted PurR-regulated permease PerM
MRIERQIAFWVAAFLVFVGLLWPLDHILLPFVAGAALAFRFNPLAIRTGSRPT